MNKTVHADRLVPFNEAAAIVGFKSRTSLYAAIDADPAFPRPIYRGRQSFFLESELLGYLSRLAAQRNAEASSARASAAKQAAQRMVAGRIAKRVAHAAAKENFS